GRAAEGDDVPSTRPTRQTAYSPPNESSSRQSSPTTCRVGAPSQTRKADNDGQPALGQAPRTVAVSNMLNRGGFRCRQVDGLQVRPNRVVPWVRVLVSGLSGAWGGERIRSGDVPIL